MRGEWCATVLLVALLATEAAEAQLVARRITQETARTDLFSGSDAVGGAGDWFLSNGIVRAIIDDIGVQTDLAIPGQPAPPPIANLAAPSGGTVIDLGLVGKRNDQLPQVLQIVNFNTASPIVYVPASVALGNAALPAVAARVDEAEGLAQLKVYGYVPMPDVSDGSNRALPARTEYTVRRGENYLRLATTVTNLSANPVPL